MDGLNEDVQGCIACIVTFKYGNLDCICATLSNDMMICDGGESAQMALRALRISKVA